MNTSNSHLSSAADGTGGRRILGALPLLAVTALLFYVCLLKLDESDFWWHVKAGELIWRSGALIRQEPFSYVLASKPYGALHEWLAQVAFFLIYRTGGVTASVLFRGVIAVASTMLLLSLDRRSVFAAAPLLATAFYLQRPNLMVRPQLFTILLLCALLRLLLGYLGHATLGQHAVRGRRWRLLAGIAVVQVLWVNLHGASAIFGVLLAGALFLQGGLEWLRATPGDRGLATEELRFRALVLAVAALALLGSPNGFKTFDDMYLHRFDPTIPLIREWMRPAWPDYARLVLPFGIVAGGLTLAGRRAWAFCATVLVVTGALSLQANRHGVVFVLVCSGVIIFQLATWAPWTVVRDRIAARPVAASVGAVLVLAVLGAGMYRRDLPSVFRTGTFGVGVRIPVQGAVEFAEREGVRGTLFNPYDQGGYILWRCSPGCKVFADGRNIEYGYPFLQRLMDARSDLARWRELDATYGFTYAIVDYSAVPTWGTVLPYITHLQADPSWVLVYVDDTAAVYVRDLPQYASLIRRFAYRVVTPSLLEFSEPPDRASAYRWWASEDELRRVVAANPHGIKARLLLGYQYLMTDRTQQAETIARDALAAQAYRPEVLRLLGRISAERKDWVTAARHLDAAIALTPPDAPALDYDYLATVFAKAGDAGKAERYRRKALGQ